MLLEKDTQMGDYRQCLGLFSQNETIVRQVGGSQGDENDKGIGLLTVSSSFLFFPRINTSSVTERAWSTWGASTTMQRKRDEAHRRGLPPLPRRFGKRKKPSQPLF